MSIAGEIITSKLNDEDGLNQTSAVKQWQKVVA
mgnify:CR=1 FL=1